MNAIYFKIKFISRVHFGRNFIFSYVTSNFYLTILSTLVIYSNHFIANMKYTCVTKLDVNSYFTSSRFTSLLDYASVNIVELQ